MEQNTERPIVWINVGQAAARAQVGKQMVYAAARSGRLRVARLGARAGLRFRPEWVDAWCEAAATPQEISYPRVVRGGTSNEVRR